MRWLIIPLLLTPFGGCIVQDEVPDKVLEQKSHRTADGAHIEVIPSMTEATLLVNRNSGGTLDFTFHYELGALDDEGIEQVDWTYRLVDSNEVEFAAHSQRMRKPNPDKTGILVRGDRTRHLNIERGLEVGKTYIIWFSLFYRGELFKEYLAPVEATAEL